MVRNIYYHIRRIGKIRGHLDDETTAKVIQALITSRLDINNGLLAGTSQSNTHRLQVRQNTASHHLTRTKRSEYIYPILHWLPIEKRIEYKVLVQVFRSLHGNTFPVYLRDLVVLYTQSRSLRSSDPHLLSVPMSHSI